MSKLIKVYIASPYTIGDTARNVKRQIDCADELINLGFAPFATLLSHFQHMIHQQPYEKWIELDFEWLDSCDCLLRLTGESKGADMEIDKMLQIGKPVFHYIQDLIKFYH